MNTFPEQDPPSIETSPESSHPLPQPPYPDNELPSANPVDPPGADLLLIPTPEDERPLFSSWSEPEILPPTRIPHLGHVLLLGVLALLSLLPVLLLTVIALHYHLFGISDINSTGAEIHYTLGTMGALYLFTFASAWFVFPLLWHKSLLAGLQWRAATAMHFRGRLFAAAAACFVLAIVNGIVMPGPTNTPIDKIFRTPGAAWLLFVFGITFAPFFEEVIFRGFLLPAVCTACDWIAERATGSPSLSPDQNGQPNWSVPAMLVGSLLVSIPFALIHAEQTGWSFGPLLLLICVSLVLCWARLSTRSLAASVLVHASYNFLIFFIMLVGTSGFRHLDKM